MKFEAICLSDPGKMRTSNEDSVFCDEATGLFILADGMGGHASGKQASKLAVESIHDYLSRWRNETAFIWPFDPDAKRTKEENHLATALKVANVRVYNAAQKSAELNGMGTTAMVLMMKDASLVIGHVGDSRCYTIVDGEICQVTKDHSLVNQLMRAFNLSETEAVAKANKNVLVQSIGMDEDIMPQVLTIEPKKPTTVLLCSDGLTDMMEDESIAQIIKSNPIDIKQAAQTLLNEANLAGGLDNISIILIRIHP